MSSPFARKKILKIWEQVKVKNGAYFLDAMVASL